jgi:cytochrome b561
MEDNKPLSEKESLALITTMIQRAKNTFHESGTSAILWGSVIGFCGLFSYAQLEWHFSIGFDIWLLTIAAVIPQVWISIRESKRQTVRSHEEFATDMVWLVYIVSIVALVLYGNIVPGVSQKFYESEDTQLMAKTISTGEIKEWRIIIPSLTSVFLIVYAFPTLATGLINKFKAMIWGAIVCYAFFIASLFTSFKYDMLMSGLAGIGNWLIPGLLLRKWYIKEKRVNV